MKDHSKMEVLKGWLDEKLFTYILCSEIEKSSFFVNSNERISVINNKFDRNQLILVCYDRSYVNNGKRGEYEVFLFPLDGSGDKDYVVKEIDEVYKILNLFIESDLKKTPSMRDLYI